MQTNANIYIACEKFIKKYIFAYHAIVTIRVI